MSDPTQAQINQIRAELDGKVSKDVFDVWTKTVDEDREEIKGLRKLIIGMCITITTISIGAVVSVVVALGNAS